MCTKAKLLRKKTWGHFKKIQAFQKDNGERVGYGKKSIPEDFILNTMEIHCCAGETGLQKEGKSQGKELRVFSEMVVPFWKYIP